jgi:trk system potassium uptake protein TrkH
VSRQRQAAAPDHAAEESSYAGIRAVQNVLPVLRVFGLILTLFSAAMLLPLIVAALDRDGAAFAYAQGFAVTFGGGLALMLVTRGTQRELQIRDGFLLVTLVWSVLPAFAALPLLTVLPGVSFTDAYFECLAGLATTGATVFSGLDGLPQSVNFWRCLLQWLGGMGVIVLAVGVLPLLGVGGRQIFRAETPGSMKDTKLTPRMTETAKGLWTVYALITAACTLAYWAAGMPFLDAVMHGFSTMSLGGFSNHDASLGHYDSPLIEAVSVAFMLVAAMNFATHFLALRKGTLSPYRSDPEARWLLLLLLVSSLAVAAHLWWRGVYPDFATALRFAAFNVVSVATTTGYANTDYGGWPAFATMYMLFLCCISSSAGSTGGGIKLVRVQLLLLQGLREMVKLIHPHAQLPVKLAGHVVPNQIVFAVLAFMSLWGASVTAMTLLLLASGLDFISSFTAVIACITNTGPGLNEVGPARTYESLTDFQIWVCATAVLVGRLELFTVLVIFTPAFWRK